MSAKKLYNLIHNNKGNKPLLCTEYEGGFLLSVEINVTQNNKEELIELLHANYFGCDEEIKEGETIQINISSSNHARENNVYFSSKHALASYYVNPSAINNNDFYIADINYDSTEPDSKKSQEIKSVLSIIKIGKILTLLSNYFKNKDLIFVNQSTMTVNIQFDYNELTEELIKLTTSNVFQSALGEINDWVDIEAEKQHLQQKKTVFSSQLFNLLNTTIENDNYSIVLSNFEKLVKNTIASYQLYMDDFSFSRFEKKLEERSLDFYEKINKAVLSIRNQVLALPVAFVFINVIRSNFNGLDPLLILIPLFAYCLILILMLDQQMLYLNDLEQDNKDFTKQNSSALGFNEALKTTNNKITQKIKTQRKTIYWFYAFVLFFVLYGVIAIFGINNILSFMSNIKHFVEFIIII